MPQFEYSSQFALTKETINGIYNKELTRTYTTSGMKGKVAGMGIDGASLYGYSYDSYGRLNKITTASGDFNYSRLEDSDLVSQMTRPNNVTTNWTYEPHRDLLTKMANGTVSTFDYVNNAIGNCTTMKRSGSAFSTADTINYSYNSRSEIIGALSNALPSYNFNYAYDPIGNRLTSTQEGENFTYTSNNLNQYTKINMELPTYDADGNMLTRDGWTQVWNGENRMIATFKGNQRLEFDYDYMGRRIFKKVYDGNTLTTHTRFVYDDYKLIQELNALNSNALLRQYVWQPEAVGLDVPLSVFDAAANQTYYYNADANKNISDLTAANGSVVTHYEYTPFGSQTTAIGSYTGNPFRFSSEYFDSETELLYYNYRYYDTELGRWLTKDPIGEWSGYNLYSFISNRSVLNYDLLGLQGFNNFNGPGSGNYIPFNPLTDTGRQELKIVQDTYNARRDRHRDRNKNNKCPQRIPPHDPHDECNDYGPDDLFSYPGGNDYKYEGRPGFHGNFRTFRGVGENNTGSQCTYDEDGNLIDSGPFLGTYDYVAPFGPDGVNYGNVPGHFIEDVYPHFFDDNYTPNLTTIID